MTPEEARELREKLGARWTEQDLPPMIARTPTPTPTPPALYAEEAFIEPEEETPPTLPPVDIPNNVNPGEPGYLDYILNVMGRGQSGQPPGEEPKPIPLDVSAEEAKEGAAGQGKSLAANFPKNVSGKIEDAGYLGANRVGRIPERQDEYSRKESKVSKDLRNAREALVNASTAEQQAAIYKQIGILEHLEAVEKMQERRDTDVKAKYSQMLKGMDANKKAEFWEKFTHALGQMTAGLYSKATGENAAQYYKPASLYDRKYDDELVKKQFESDQEQIKKRYGDMVANLTARREAEIALPVEQQQILAKYYNILSGMEKEGAPQTTSDASREQKVLDKTLQGASGGASGDKPTDIYEPPTANQMQMLKAQVEHWDINNGNIGATPRGNTAEEQANDFAARMSYKGGNVGSIRAAYLIAHKANPKKDPSELTRDAANIVQDGMRARDTMKTQEDVDWWVRHFKLYPGMYPEYRPMAPLPRHERKADGADLYNPSTHHKPEIQEMYIKAMRKYGLEAPAPVAPPIHSDKTPQFPPELQKKIDNMSPAEREKFMRSRERQKGGAIQPPPQSAPTPPVPLVAPMPAPATPAPQAGKTMSREDTIKNFQSFDAKTKAEIVSVMSEEDLAALHATLFDKGGVPAINKVLAVLPTELGDRLANAGGGNSNPPELNEAISKLKKTGKKKNPK